MEFINSNEIQLEGSLVYAREQVLVVSWNRKYKEEKVERGYIQEVA